MNVQHLTHRTGPSVAFLLRVADLALLRQDYDQVETLIELVYDHFDHEPQVDC